MSEFNDWEIMENNTYNLKIKVDENKTDKNVVEQPGKVVEQPGKVSEQPSKVSDQPKVEINKLNELKEPSVSEKATKDIVLDIDEVVIKKKDKDNKNRETDFIFGIKKTWKMLCDKLSALSKLSNCCMCCKNTTD